MMVLALFVVDYSHHDSTNVASHVGVEWYVRELIHSIEPVDESFVPVKRVDVNLFSF